MTSSVDDLFLTGSPLCDRVEQFEKRLLWSEPPTPEEAEPPPTFEDVDAALAFFEAALREHPDAYGTCIWDTFSRLCHDPRIGDRVLDWLKRVAPSLSAKQREGLRIGTLELLPEAPASWRVLRRLWLDFWFVPAVRWCVFAAYETEPELFRKHWRHFRKVARREGRPVPHLRDGEYQRWRATV